MIYFVCPQCHSVFHVQDKMAGRKAKCPKCKAEFIIPAACPPVKESIPSTVSEDIYKLAKKPSAPLDGLDESMSLPPSRLSPFGPALGQANLRKPRRESKWPQVLLYSVLGLVILCVAVGTTVVVTQMALNGLPKLSMPSIAAAPKPESTQHEDKPKTNLAIFESVHRVVTELRAAQDIGMNRKQFRGLLQRFSTEVVMAKEKARLPAEKKIAESYWLVLEIYKDSDRIWGVKMNIPTYKELAEQHYDMDKLDPRADAVDRYFGFLQAILSGIPLDLYPDGKSGLDPIVAQYSIPVTKERGYRIVSEDSIPLLWQKAEERLKEIKKLMEN